MMGLRLIGEDGKPLSEDYQGWIPEMYQRVVVGRTEYVVNRVVYDLDQRIAFAYCSFPPEVKRAQARKARVAKPGEKFLKVKK